MEEILSQLISIVQDTAPALWAIARRQVVADLVTMVIWLVICLVATIVLVKVAKYGMVQYQKDRYSAWDMVAAFSVIGAITTAVATVGVTCSIAQYLVNPNYYTIKVLMDLIRT